MGYNKRDEISGHLFDFCEIIGKYRKAV